MRVRSGARVVGAMALAWALASCGDNASAVDTRERAPAAGPAVASTASETAPETEVKPALTANRRETVDEKIQRLYERNGADFGARSPEDFLAKITAFTSARTEGVERVSRPNGDVLLYQASTNTFAVLARDGTPRTMFKPDEGAAYWAEQKAAAPTFGQGRSEG